MRHAPTRIWKTGILSTFLPGVFALLPIVITAGIMAWARSCPPICLPGRVVHCAFGREGGAGYLALLAPGQVYRFNRQACEIADLRTSPLTMSGLVRFAAADSVQKMDMQVDDLMKIYFTIGVMSSKVIPDQCLVPRNENVHVRDCVET